MASPAVGMSKPSTDPAQKLQAEQALKGSSGGAGALIGHDRHDLNLDCNCRRI